MARPRAFNEPSIRTELSDRQREVLRLIALGCTNPEIAHRLGITLDGAKWHVREILSRLGVDSREEAAEMWKRGDLRPPRFARLRSLVPGGLALKIAAGGGTVGFGVVGAVLLYGAFRPGSEAPGAAFEPSAQAIELTPTPEPLAVLPAGTTRSCIAGDLLISNDSRLEGSVAVMETRITKPRGCDLIERIEAVIVQPGAPPSGPREATQAGNLIAVAGTDGVTVTVRWSNWCGLVPTPVPTPSAGNSGWRPGPSPMWLMYMLTTQSGIGSGEVYPACIDAAKPTRLEISQTVTPDPPGPLTAAGMAPKVNSATDVPAFATWFAGVVEARDDAMLATLSEPLAYTCDADPHPLCTEELAGSARNGFIMSQAGSLSADVFETRLTQTTALSGPLRAAGCAVGYPACRFFVIAFESMPGNHGPGFFQAYVFESVAGAAKLRGLYPGGGDKDIVFAGGITETPWGSTAFLPIP